MADQTAVEDYDTTEKIERTDRGYRLTVETTRGSGTRDQDKVKLEARTETLQQLKEEKPRLLDSVTDAIYKLRANQPDSEDSE